MVVQQRLAMLVFLKGSWLCFRAVLWLPMGSRLSTNGRLFFTHVANGKFIYVYDNKVD
jgi:hypothetical protein